MLSCTIAATNSGRGFRIEWPGHRLPAGSQELVVRTAAHLAFALSLGVASGPCLRPWGMPNITSAKGFWNAIGSPLDAVLAAGAVASHLWGFRRTMHTLSSG